METLNSTPAVSQPEAAQTSTPEQPQEQVQVESPQEKSPLDDIDFSSKFAALTRKEKALLKRQKELEEKYTKASEYEKTMTLAKKDPVKFLESVGLSYKEITDFLLNDNKPTVESQLDELRREYENEKKQRELEKEKQELERKKQEEAHFAQVVENHKKQIRSFLDTNRDNYELCAMNDATEDIFEVIEEYYQRNNEILPIDKAAEAVEKYLEQEAMKLFQAKKLAAKRSITEDGSKTETPAQSVSKTITNKTGEFTLQDTSQLSDEESKAIAAKLLKWN